MYKGASRFLQHLTMKDKEKPPQKLDKKQDTYGIPSHIKRIARTTGLIRGCFHEEVKGGYIVDIEGFQAFCPHSEMDPDVVPNAPNVQKQVQFRIIKVDVEKRSVIVSRKRAAEQQGWEMAVDAFNKGRCLIGTVKEIKEYGAFVDLGGIDGLLHKSEVSNQYVDDISKVLTVGKRVRSFVIDIDSEKHRIALSLRRKGPVIRNFGDHTSTWMHAINKDLFDPTTWRKIKKSYSGIRILEGTIIGVIESGAYVNIDGICGFMPKNEIHDGPVKDILTELKNGQRVRVLVYELDEDNKIVYLSMRLTSHSIREVSELIKSKIEGSSQK